MCRIFLAASLLALALPPAAPAQDWADRGGVYLLVDTEAYSTLGWPDLERLFSTFGPQGVAAERSEPFLPPLDFDRSVRVGVGVYVATLTAEVAFQPFTSETSFTLPGGVATRYETVGHAWTFDVGLLVPVGPLEVGGGLGMFNTDGQLRASTEYADGTVSYGDDSPLNGVWTLEAMTLQAHLKSVLRLGPVGVYGRIEWLDPFNVLSPAADIGIVQEDYGQGPSIDSDVYSFNSTLFVGGDPVIETYDGIRGTVGLVLILGS
ncbi:MAG: hypothetical protein AAGK21_08675 [Bacteroidota bacterium]